MANYAVISEVGQSLAKVLRDALVPELIAHPDGVGLAHPAERGDMNLSLHLYEVKENSDYRSNEMIAEGNTVRFPSIALDLTYLVTAHSSSDILSRAIDEHRILGRTLQVLHDHNILRGIDLVGSLAGSNESFRIVKNEFAVDQAMKFFPNVPYKLSLSYTIGPVFIDSTRMRTASRVKQRDFKLRRK